MKYGKKSHNKNSGGKKSSRYTPPEEGCCSKTNMIDHQKVADKICKSVKSQTS